MDKVLILDFGGQYTQLIARRVRELRVYSEIHPFHMPAAEIRAFRPKALILSGSPASIYQPNAPRPDTGILDLGVPVLGICYGLCILADFCGGEVSRAARREYGPADLLVDRAEDLFTGLPGQGGCSARHVPGAGPYRQLPVCCLPSSGASLLRRPVPPRGRPYAAGERHSGQLPVPGRQV